MVSLYTLASILAVKTPASGQHILSVGANHLITVSENTITLHKFVTCDPNLVLHTCMYVATNSLLNPALK